MLVKKLLNNSNQSFYPEIRDVLETRLDLGGYPVNICDTAGLRHETNDPIEKEGIDRALTAANQADLVRNYWTDLDAVLAVVVCAGWCLWGS